MKKFLFYFLLGTAVFAEIPKRIESNIYKASLNVDEKNEYVKDQRRAYNRIESKGKKAGLTEAQIDSAVQELEKKYGNNYEVIYKYFSLDIKEIEKQEKIKIERKKIEKKYEESYKKEISKSTLPTKVKRYIEDTAAKKYPTSYQERVRYVNELTDFYNFIKKN